MLEELKKTIQQKVQTEKNRIIVGVYQNMINAHHELCGCNYCRVLKKYVDQKRFLARVRRLSDDPNELYLHSRGSDYYLNWMSDIKENIKKLKIEKDQLKKL